MPASQSLSIIIAVLAGGLQRPKLTEEGYGRLESLAAKRGLTRASGCQDAAGLLAAREAEAEEDNEKQ